MMRVYFFNPNNDSGQDWGDGVRVSTADNGELSGEASLPFEQFASRLYIFHYDPLERGEPAAVSEAELEAVTGYIQRSWGADRMPASGRGREPVALNPPRRHGRIAFMDKCAYGLVRPL
ncbi:MAG: hypothetical protein U5L11_07135 [Arhodomonas sp.]|nr:hypothetical protein [Arhodomonas sp.]